METSNQKIQKKISPEIPRNRGKRQIKISGLGDLIKWILGLIGFRSCAVCERRRAWLNRILPFRRMTFKEKINRAMYKLHGQAIDDNGSAALYLKHKKDIIYFREVFGYKFEELARDKDKRFQILFFGNDILHCALTPTPYTKVKIKREDRKQIEKEIKEKTRWKRVKWHA